MFMLLETVFLHLWIIIFCISSLNLSASLLDIKRNHYTTQGLWVIVGLLFFLLLEKMFPDQESQEDNSSDSDLNFNSAVSVHIEIVRSVECSPWLLSHCTISPAEQTIPDAYSLLLLISQK